MSLRKVKRIKHVRCFQEFHPVLSVINEFYREERMLALIIVPKAIIFPGLLYA